MKTTYVTKIETVSSGGGCMVDLITLSDGRVIGINDEAVGLYDTEEKFWNGGECLEAFYIPQKQKAGD